MNWIFTSDWHLRGDVPRCRKQTKAEWWAFQLQRVNEVVQIANEKDAALVVVGDIFHHWNLPEYLLNGLIEALMHLNHYALVMRGNHDMKHRDTSVEHTAFGTLTAFSRSMGKIRLAESEMAVLPYGKEGYEWIKSRDKQGPLLIHQLCFPTDKDIPAMVEGATSADRLMREYDYDLIICGDGHNPFHRGYVINCGSLFQQSVKEVHEPSVWFAPKDCSHFERIFLRKDLTEIVEDSYAEVVAQRDARFDAFVEIVGSMESSSLSWEDALRSATKKVDPVKEVVLLLEDIIEVSRESAV